jgi:hypothetical protein
MRILIALLLCITLVSCSKKDEQLKKISQDLKVQEQKLEQERKDLEKINKDKEEELKKAKDDYDKTIEENNKSGKYPGKYPFASTRELSTDDLKDLSDFDIKVMKSEILARHGFIFKDDEMKFYFSGQKWYKPKYDNVDKMLSDKEKLNYQFIETYEIKKKKKVN